MNYELTSRVQFRSLGEGAMSRAEADLRNKNKLTIKTKFDLFVNQNENVNWSVQPRSNKSSTHFMYKQTNCEFRLGPPDSIVKDLD